LNGSFTLNLAQEKVSQQGSVRSLESHGNDLQKLKEDVYIIGMMKSGEPVLLSVRE
jgi:hypothetical protein